MSALVGLWDRPVASEKTVNGDTIVRWVGVTPPDGDRLRSNEDLTSSYARRLADAVIADAASVEWCKEDYLDRLAVEVREESIRRRMWATGRFAGWIVRDGEVQP